MKLPAASCGELDPNEIKQVPWYVVNADNKKRVRLNCISHLLNMIPYKDIKPERIKLPERQERVGYVRPPDRGSEFCS